MNLNTLNKVLKPTNQRDLLGTGVKLIFGVYLLSKTIKTVVDLHYQIKDRKRLER